MLLQLTNTNVATAQIWQFPALFVNLVQMCWVQLFFKIVLKIICWQGATWVTTDSEAAHIIITTLITWSITQCNPLFKCPSLRWEPTSSTSLLEKHQQKWENWSVTFQVNKSCIAGFGRKWWKKNVLLQHPDKDINAKATVALKTNENIRWDKR